MSSDMEPGAHEICFQEVRTAPKPLSIGFFECIALLGGWALIVGLVFICSSHDYLAAMYSGSPKPERISFQIPQSTSVLPNRSTHDVGSGEDSQEFLENIQLYYPYLAIHTHSKSIISGKSINAIGQTHKFIFDMVQISTVESVEQIPKEKVTSPNTKIIKSDVKVHVGALTHKQILAMHLSSGGGFNAELRFLAQHRPRGPPDRGPPTATITPLEESVRSTVRVKQVYVIGEIIEFHGPAQYESSVLRAEIIDLKPQSAVLLRSKGFPMVQPGRKSDKLSKATQSVLGENSIVRPKNSPLFYPKKWLVDPPEKWLVDPPKPFESAMKRLVRMIRTR